MPIERDGQLYPSPWGADEDVGPPVEVESEEWHVPEFKGPPGWNAVPDDLVHPKRVDLTVEQKRDAQAEQVIEPVQMIGPYDAWLGVVGQVHTTGTDTLSSYKQEIYVTRVGVHYQTNNEPQGYAVASVGSQVGSTGTTALPWPVRHDQAEYLTTAGDIVTVLTGRDGRNYYMVDDEPFLAQVTSDGGAVTEANMGGAGLTALTVIRKALAGDPTSTVLTGFSDLQNASSVDIAYTDVIPVGPLNSSHGLRCGDRTWVFRRGRYMFCIKAPKVFVAEVVTTGPDSETDFTAGGQGSDTPYYWFKEQTPTITYGGSGNQFTVTWAQLTQTDPTGSGGRYGRWGAALNLVETSAVHGLNSGDLVVVTEVGDGTSAEVGYVIERLAISSDVPAADYVWIYNGTSMQWEPKDQSELTAGGGTMDGTINSPMVQFAGAVASEYQASAVNVIGKWITIEAFMYEALSPPTTNIVNIPNAIPGTDNPFGWWIGPDFTTTQTLAAVGTEFFLEVRGNGTTAYLWWRYAGHDSNTFRGFMRGYYRTSVADVILP